MNDRNDPIRELKVRAELLHHAVARGERQALLRLRALAELRKADEAELAARGAALQRKHCLAVVGREAGFAGWEHARRVLTGEPEEDIGKLLYASTGGAFLHPWFVRYAEAKALHAGAAREGGDVAGDPEARYLLGYARQFFLAGPAFVEALGLDPDDADFAAIGFDWPRPRDRAARSRLYAKLLRAHATTRLG